MKRFLALFATLAIVVSMFSGVAFATAVPGNVAVTASLDTTIAGESAVLTLQFDDVDGGNVANEWDGTEEVVLDFSATDFTFIGVKEVTGGASVVSINGQVVTVNITSDADTVVLYVTNPSTVANHEVCAVSVNGTAITTNPTVDIHYDVTLTPEELVIGDTVSFSGTVREAGQVPTDILVYEVYKATDLNGNKGTKVDDGYVLISNGTFSVAFDASTKDQYGYVVDIFNSTDNVTTTKVLGAKYVLTINEDLSACKYGDSVYVTGTLTEADGTPVSDATITVAPGSGTAETDTTRSNGTFALAVNVNGVGDLTVSVDTVEYVSYEIEPLSMEIEVSPAETVHTIKDTAVVFKAYYLDSDGNKVYLPAAELTFTIDGAGFDEVAIVDELSDADADTVEDTLDINESGTITVTGQWDGGKRVGTATIEVASPSKANLSLTWSNAALDVNSNPHQLTIDVLDAQGKDPANSSVIDSFDYTIAGLGLNVTAEGKTTSAVETGLNVEEAGTVTVTVTVNYADDTSETFTRTFDFDGYMVDVSVDEALVDTETDITVVVTDSDGNPVNNASVTIVETGDNIPATANINNGVYTFEDVTFTTVGNFTITVADGANTMATFTGEVKGEVAYEVSVDKSTLLAGLEEDVIVTVKDLEGNIVMLPLNSVTVGGVGADSYYDSDEDGINDSYKFVDVVSTDVDNGITVAVATDSNKKIGSTTIEVLNPEVNVSYDTLTDNVTEEFTVQVVDPRTGDVLTDADVALVVNPAEDIDAFNPAPVITFDSDNNVFNVELKAVRGIDADEDELFNVLFTVTVLNGANPDQALTDILSLPVEPGTVEIAPEDIYIGHNNEITITVKNARGEVMEGVDVYFGLVPLGATNEEGVVTYNFTPASSGTIIVSAAFGASTTFTPVVDKEKPVIDLSATPVEVDMDTEFVTVTGTVSDNIGVQTIYVNNTAIPFIPETGFFSYEVALRGDETVVNVFAFDKNGNGAIESITIKKVAPVVEAVTITVGETNEYIDQAPYIVVTEENIGRAMVPVRFIANVLGAELDWNPDTKTATYTLGDIVVEITAGSTTAVVNGENVTLDVAAEITGNRMCVPVRFAAEAFGAKVDYEHATKTITVTPQQ